MEPLKIKTDVLEIACEAHGPRDGHPVILLHGFPYDPRCFDEVAPPLAARGCRVYVPYLRGYGSTRFLSAATPRSGEQAALGHDLVQFMQALGIEQLQIGPQIDPGVPWCHAHAELSPAGLHIALKSGNFGGVDFFTRSFALLQPPA